ncbi:MAG: copper chaperone PCu(A)C [Notoacmeibacter sp.]|nr:copper chaperone PCu(A)C [Notoacmeibacter sp.]
MRNLHIQFSAALALTAAAIFTAPALGASATSPVKAIDPVVTSAMDMPTIEVGNLELTGIWARAMLPGQRAGGGFVTIKNTGAQDDRLLSVSTDAAGKSEIHEMAVIDGVMKMRPLSDGLVIPAGESVELKPGGYHLMFMNVPEPFAEGTTVKVTLTFEGAGAVDLELPVKPADTSGMKHNHGG